MPKLPIRPGHVTPNAAQTHPSAPDAGAFDRTLAGSQAERRRTERVHARMREKLVEEPARRGEDPYELLAKAISRLLRS